MTVVPDTTRALYSTILPSGSLELELKEEAVPVPGDDEVIVRVEAAPLNPSDMGVFLSFADVTTVEAVEDTSGRKTRMAFPEAGLPRVASRVGKPLRAGNEGAGTVVAAGSNAQGLLGKLVATRSGTLYADYACVPAMNCLPMPEGTRPEDAAASFVNPLTVLAMLETMRNEGHSAIVNTAAASNLGRMMIRVCLEDGIPLVNIVRKSAQVEELKALGAEYVCSTDSGSFHADLVEALKASGATLAFDATGGGTLASEILRAMERAVSESNPQAYSVYGSTTYKQLYVYGGLDRSPLTLNPLAYGFCWGVGAWLLSNELAKFPLEKIVELQQRVAGNITTLFASHYTDEISLEQILDPDMIRAYSKQASGQKYLMRNSHGQSD